MIVGGGIGGLEAALALSHDGHNITVLDSVKEFAEVSKTALIKINRSDMPPGRRRHSHTPQLLPPEHAMGR